MCQKMETGGNGNLVRTENSKIDGSTFYSSISSRAFSLKKGESNY